MDRKCSTFGVVIENFVNKFLTIDETVLKRKYS
jgi:hypothetical protein